MGELGGKLCLKGPGNGLHSNVQSEKWEQMDTEHAGLDIIGQSGVPVTVSYQGIDFELLPWLRETIAKHPNIQLTNATHSHCLIPFCGSVMASWQTAKVFGDTPITFFAEYYAPSEEHIPTEFFLFLEGMSYPYSDFTSSEKRDVEVGSFGNAPSIKYGGKIGINMRESLFMPFLSAFQRFQRDPFTADETTKGKHPLDYLLDQVEAIGNGKNIVVCPLDIEAPYVGSKFGAKIYQMFFDGVIRRGLSGVFAHLSDYLDYFRDNAVPSKRPHRILPKWCNYEVQVKYLMALAATNPRSEREKILHSIASGSDILSAWERKIGESKKAIVLNGRDEAGNEVKLPISYSQQVIDVQDAARRALVERRSYLELLQAMNEQSLFVRRMIAYAKKHRL